MEKKKDKKNFILGLTAASFLVLAGRAVLAGVIQATAALVAKDRWEKWKEKRK